MSDLNTHKPLLRFNDYSENWINNKLKNLCVVNQGLQIPIADRVKEPTPTAKPYITIQFLNNSKEAEYVENPSDSVICNEDDILMTRTGNTGIVVSNVNGVFHNNFFKINYNRGLLNKVFLIETLGLPKIKKEILLKAGASTIPDLNHKDFYSISINFPSLEEQTKIATFLSAVDSKITSLERLVAHWQAYKKGIMQQIFTQQLRFKAPNSQDFPEWEYVQLNEVLDYEQPGPYIVSNDEYNDNYSIPVLTAGKTFVLGYTNEEFGIYNSTPIILFDDFTTASKFVDFKFKVKSSAIKILKAKNGNSIKFLFEAMQNIKYAIGGHERHWISKYSLIEIGLPSIEEQTKIAIFLSSLDDKIAHLQQQLTSYRQFKKALLQQMFV